MPLHCLIKYLLMGWTFFEASVYPKHCMQATVLAETSVMLPAPCIAQLVNCCSLLPKVPVGKWPAASFSSTCCA
jgi:hypothetical protein